MQKRPRPKAYMYALMAYKRRSLGAAAKCACVQSKWAFLGAPTSDRSAVFASASNRFQTKRSSKTNRVQNRALTPSWRSELAERLRGQHRYYKEETAALCVAFSRAKSLSGTRLHLYWLFPHTQRQKMRACFGVDVAILLSKACWRCCVRVANKYQPATIHTEKRRRMAARVA